MAGEMQQQGYGGRFFSDVNTRLRDLEEKQRLLRDKMLLITKGFVVEREKSFKQTQEFRKDLVRLKMENERFKEILLRLGEAVDKSARKEDLNILQKQFDLFRE